MNEQQKKEVRKIVREEMKKFLPELLGRSLVQIKNFFINTIK